MMSKERENSSESESKYREPNSSVDSGGKNLGSPEKIETYPKKGLSFLGKSSSEVKMVYDGCASGADVSQSKKTGSSGCQELTLSYLCDNSKLGFLDRDLSFEKMGNFKGKEIAVSEDQIDEGNRWVERDFLQLNENRGKREAENEGIEAENREKKPKIETLNLSLALPDVSLSLAGSNRVQNGDLPSRLRSSRSIQEPEPSHNNTQTTYSNDFTAASLSYSYSHPFSHNPSCSLTRNSTENYECSMGSHRRGSDHIWNCGEGTNGSVHSRFRPIGDGGVALSNHGSGTFAFGGRVGVVNKETCNNSFYRTTSSDNNSFFPSELPARPRLDGQSGDSRGKESDGLRGLEGIDGGGGRVRKLSRPERILREIVSESVPVMAQIIQELPEETVESTKEYLRSLVTMPDKKDELSSLQYRVQRRSDLTNGTLLKCHKSQLEILVAIKLGLESFLSSKTRLSTAELVEIFSLERCRNINCKRPLPVEDCDCKICSTKKGFCSECMCPVCLNFDCANNTCSWVGCDACSHWCHAVCGIQRNLIKPGPRYNGPSATTEMQFYCLGCGHASEMFGFVKDVFKSCAKDWGEETLIKELDCVRKIFQGSEDFKGKELHVKADELLTKLEKKTMSTSDVCNFIFQFFNYADGLSDFPVSNYLSKDTASQSSLKKVVSLPSTASLVPKSTFYNNMNSSSSRQDSVPADHQNEAKPPPFTNDQIVKDEWSVKAPKKPALDTSPKKAAALDSLESVVRIKEAEARMFQNKADEARREAEGLRRMARIQGEKVEEEYTEKMSKLCLVETEERRRKKLEELKTLENSHCDYYKMKMRMQGEIAGLLKRMEATKQLLVLTPH